MSYKGGTKIWSNRYYLQGPDFADNAHFVTMADDVVSQEKGCYVPAITIVEVIGYKAGSSVPAYSKAYTTAGT